VEFLLSCFILIQRHSYYCKGKYLDFSNKLFSPFILFKTLCHVHRPHNIRLNIMLKSVAELVSSYCKKSGIHFLGSTEKLTKNLGGDNRPPARNSNLEPLWFATRIVIIIIIIIIIIISNNCIRQTQLTFWSKTDIYIFGFFTASRY
jgi:hypothetical protein